MFKLKLNPNGSGTPEDKSTHSGDERKVASHEASDDVTVKSGTDSPAPSVLPKLSLSVGQPKAPKIKVKTSKATYEGYDCEAPDREEDPTMEEAIVLRVLPGSGLEHLQKACEQNNFAGVSIKFEDAKRAIVTLDEEKFAAQLVDLPTVTEIQKTFDRKNIYKTVDVCQMLLVTAKVEGDKDLVNMRPEPPLYPHGLAPPLYNVRNRRFHQRMSNKAIEIIEDKVDELFKQDAQAVEVEHKLVAPSEISNQHELSVAMVGFDTQADADEDDEEEVDEDDDDMLGMELEKALEADNSEGDGDGDDDDDDEEEDDEDGYEDNQDTKQQNKLLKEEIKELQLTIDAKQRDAENTVNQIMKGRLVDVVNKMRKELDIKYRLLQDAEEKEAQLQASVDAAGNRADENPEEDDDDMDDDEDNQSDGGVESRKAPSDTPSGTAGTVEAAPSEAEPDAGDQQNVENQPDTEMADDDGIDSLF